MGNSQTKEARGQQENGAGPSTARPEQDYVTRSSHRGTGQRRGSRPDLSTILGLASNEPDVASLEARRESKAEREQRRQEKERQARLKERERNMREEHVDGGYLVTQGVYVGPEDYSKPLVKQLMVERRLAPFWRGINDFSNEWAEHQIMAVARGMPLPAADEIPPELENQLAKRPSADAKQSLTLPIGPRSESFQSDSGRTSPANGSFLSPSSPPAGSSSIPFRSRAKTLASLGSSSRNNSDRDLTPKEYKLPHDPFVNGQPIEVFLYKDASECPICFLYYPPYLNTTRCCEQPICSECFVQIKRPDPHPPEHNDPDPNAPPVSEEERLAQAEGLLISEVATCPYCKQPEFGVTYTSPPFRRGLAYAFTGTPYGFLSARSSQTSLASSGPSPGPGRRRGTSLSANAPEVITTDKIRPDWANKLATARAHAARRSAAASALHAAAYLMNDSQTPRPPPGPFGRRNVLRRSTLENAGPATDALSFLAERNAERAQQGNSAYIAPPPRGSSSRRSRVDDLEEMMMMEAIRLSLAAEEDRRKKEEKEAKKKAKKEEKEQKKAGKAARKHGLSVSAIDGPPSMYRTESNMSTLLQEDGSKGKFAERDDVPAFLFSREGEDGNGSSAGPASLRSTSQESFSSPLAVPTGSEPFRRSHLRQMSNASSASSSVHEPGSNTPQINEPMFNFRSLAAMIDNDTDEKSDRSSHVEHAEQASGGEGGIFGSLEDERAVNDGGTSKLKEVTTIDDFDEEIRNGSTVPARD